MSVASMFKTLSDMRWGSTCLLVSIVLFCSVELMQISEGDAVLAPEEENTLEILREKFNLPHWTGDPCGSVEWIQCSNDSSSVTTLDLANKNLTGTIPAEVANLRKVQELTLFANRLRGPIPDLSNMTELRNLDLKFNNLSGQILGTVAFTDIQRIVLDDNNISGGLPPDLFNHSKLQYLYLGNNPIGGSLPDMSGLTNMKELSLRNISITGSIPESIQKLTQATHILLYENPGLKGPIPDISSLTNLQYFDSKSCALNGSLPDLKEAPDLIHIRLEKNDLSGSIPPALFQHDKLSIITLNNNTRLSGEIPDTSGLLSLENLFLNDCNLTGPVPSSFKTNINVKYVGLQNNRLTSVPSDLTDLTKLVVLDVHNNSMTGNLPSFPPSDKIEYLNFGENHFSGEIPSSWYGLSLVKGWEVAQNNLTGGLQKEIGNLTSLTKLIVSRNRLSGTIPEEFGQLSELVTLELDNNQFTGNVPEALAHLPKLQTLSLHNNNFTGIPEAIINLQNAGSLNLTYDAHIKILTGKSKSDVSAGVIAGVVVGVGALVAVAAVLVIVLYKRKKKFKDELSRDDLPKSAQGFTLKEIKGITGNYKTLVGKGGFGSVYYGKLPDGKEIAVKVRSADSKQGAREFCNEVQLLSRLHHRNLVPLVGYCLEGQEQILVYTYMTEGTLYDHIYHAGSGSSPSEGKDKFTRPSLNWKTRLDIAIDAARGLEYLHKDCNPPVIHRDVKASNILLDETLEAKIADLGISKQVPEPDSTGVYNISAGGVSTAVKGTFGYLDPEYFVRRKLTTKSDVFSFGMVLLEIVTGRGPHIQEFPGTGETTLIEWVEDAVASNKLESIVDPALGGEYNTEGMLRVVKTALSCLVTSGAERPDMGEILITLTDALEMETKSGATAPVTLTTEHGVPTVLYSGQLSGPEWSSSSFTQSSSPFSTNPQPPCDTEPR